jgi:hypothetical protein
VRASKKSAEWCLKAVDVCWSQKERTYRADEKEQAAKDYEHARQTYTRLIAESADAQDARPDAANPQLRVR